MYLARKRVCGDRQPENPKENAGEPGDEKPGQMQRTEKRKDNCPENVFSIKVTPCPENFS